MKLIFCLHEKKSECTITYGPLCNSHVVRCDYNAVAEDDLKQLAVAFDRQAHEPMWLLHQLQERRKGAELRLWHAYNDAVRSAQAGAKTVVHKVGSRDAQSEDRSHTMSESAGSAPASGPEGWWLSELRWRLFRSFVDAMLTTSTCNASI